MGHNKIVVVKGTTAPDVLDTLEGATVEYMRTKRNIDEAAMRKLIHEDADIRASYSRKIERMVRMLIIDGIPAKFFGRTA